jgi:MFS transporter, DHA1 family, multidrug resistance protein
MDWRGIFVFLTVYGFLVIFVAIFFLVNTYPAA